MEGNLRSESPFTYLFINSFCLFIGRTLQQIAGLNKCLPTRCSTLLFTVPLCEIWSKRCGLWHWRWLFDDGQWREVWQSQSWNDVMTHKKKLFKQKTIQNGAEKRLVLQYYFLFPTLFCCWLTAICPKTRSYFPQTCAITLSHIKQLFFCA